MRSAYERIEAEAPTANNGGVIDGGHVGSLGNGDWLEYGTVDFGSSGPYQVNSLVSGGSSGSGLVTYRVDSPTGPVVADFAIANTGGWNTYKQIPANAGGVTGEHKLYVTFKSGYSGDYVNLDRFQFSVKGAPRPDLMSAYTVTEAEQTADRHRKVTSRRPRRPTAQGHLAGLRHRRLRQARTRPG
ncbi:MAG: carbohydrate-binding protein [Candidatus Nanopelagicales bacterium]